MNDNSLFETIRAYSRYVEISRINLQAYPGICRRVYVMEDKIKIDYIDYTYLQTREGEESFYFNYDCFEDVLASVKGLIDESITCPTFQDHSIDNWKFTCYYYETLRCSWNKFFDDLQCHRLIFPNGFSTFWIKSIYATAIYLGVINTTDDEKTVFDSLKMHRIEINKARDFKSY